MQTDNGKYHQLKQSLDNLDTFLPLPSTQPPAYFYFKSLSSLSTDLILEQTEKINELQSKIEFMKNKYAALAVKYAQKKKKEEQKRLVHCQYENCKDSFEKDKQLHYHKLFVHEDVNINQNALFTFTVHQEPKQ